MAARDGGCRFPGSTAPAAWAEVHHLVARTKGGDHHPENLALLIRRWHLLVHRRRWKLHLDPDTGELTITRNGRTWHSLPSGTPLRRSPPPSGPPAPDRQLE
ncbi:MAG: HNH endonuclease [Actinomycetota bacterium]|nr:HNH endonuclease [Actinomycetota bacterium]